MRAANLGERKSRVNVAVAPFPWRKRDFRDQRTQRPPYFPRRAGNRVEAEAKHAHAAGGILARILRRFMAKVLLAWETGFRLCSCGASFELVEWKRK